MLRQDGGRTEAATANPNSLRQAAINIPALPKKGRRLSSSAPAQKADGGQNQEGLCPAGRPVPQPSPRPGWGSQGGCGKGVHPHKRVLPTPRRASCFAAKASGDTHKTHPPTKGCGLSAALYQPPESPHASAGAASGCAEAKPSVAGPHRAGKQEKSLPLPLRKRRRMGPKSVATAAAAGASCRRWGGAGPPGWVAPKRGANPPLGCPGMLRPCCIASVLSPFAARLGPRVPRLSPGRTHSPSLWRRGSRGVGAPERGC